MFSRFLDSHFTLCTFMIEINGTMCMIQINLLVALSADRYLAVCKPIKYFNQRSSGNQKFIVLTCVILAVLNQLPITLGWNSGVHGTCYIIDILAFDYMLMCGMWTTVAFVVIMIHYVLIYKSLSERVS